MAAANVGTVETVWSNDIATANERFKKRSGPWLCVSIILATIIHLALIQFFPPLTAADVSFGVTELEAVDLPPEIEIPPAPEMIERPAIPVVAHTPLYEDVTIAPTTFEDNPVEELPPPPTSAVIQVQERPVFTPFTVAPRLRDPRQAASTVLNKYPKLLQDAGVEGTVVVWALVDETGVVRNCQIHTSCGNTDMDRSALEAVTEFEFVPALNHDKHVPVWISMPITFTIDTAADGGRPGGGR
jgi:protein TonB